MGIFSEDDDLKVYYDDGKLVMTYNNKTDESILYHENGNPLMRTSGAETAIYNENNEPVEIGITLKEKENGEFELVKGDKVVAKVDNNGEITSYLYSTGETMLKINDINGVTEFFFKNGNTFMKQEGDSWEIYNEEGEKIAGDFEEVTDIKKLD